MQLLDQCFCCLQQHALWVLMWPLQLRLIYFVTVIIMTCSRVCFVFTKAGFWSLWKKNPTRDKQAAAQRNLKCPSTHVFVSPVGFPKTDIGVKSPCFPFLSLCPASSVSVSSSCVSRTAGRCRGKCMRSSCHGNKGMKREHGGESCECMFRSGGEERFSRSIY